MENNNSRRTTETTKVGRCKYVINRIFTNDKEKQKKALEVLLNSKPKQE